MLYCGIYCMDTAMRTFPRFIFGDMVREYFGLKSREYWKHRERESLSPVRIINEKFPPAFIVYAGKDPIKKQSLMMIDKLKELGADVDGYFEPAGGHDFQLSLHKEHAKRCMENTLEWLDRVSNK
jgi:acetyl esterase/lipase